MKEIFNENKEEEEDDDSESLSSLSKKTSSITNSIRGSFISPNNNL